MVRGRPGETVMLTEPVSWIILHQLKIVLRLINHEISSLNYHRVRTLKVLIFRDHYLEKEYNHLKTKFCRELNDESFGKSIRPIA